ncbi:Similar to methyltransferase, putative [Coccidioides posadasii C735 delta SOWgp]; acc. no. XP_003065123 [Pyronema omphalodes CBS 100304]|uniref:Similar to methyltransferase, putative [Coccidioides posadasii C735 delta SOWgp] acc. no. XP_003065123 n=1 Tax=Pyronema omphalodes (strain CBS 100304) TaxID=1076935 RepID=U4L1D8_PYROM|nr:Similar to methyltransferase, putative [Coccidioides posadasii C735 delta SOWgp]; acc. no. XP_003065123 [Pyronema omphalodes CBS 100304]
MENERHSPEIEIDRAVLKDKDEYSYESAGLQSDSASVSSSIHQYMFENGRRYHAHFYRIIGSKGFSRWELSWAR